MKQVIAIIKPHVTQKVLESLTRIPLVGQCVFREVKGFGRQKNYLGLYRGSEYSTAYLPKICILFGVEEEHLSAAINAVVSSARSGRMGDGKIFVFGDGFWYDISAGPPEQTTFPASSPQARPASA